MSQAGSPSCLNDNLGAGREAGPSWRWAAAIILAAGGIVFIAGLAGHVLIADEVYHYGFAEAWGKAGRRGGK